MFEGAVAAFLNRLLGRYVEDLDTEHFNVGIFSGDTCLMDVRLKPEALYQLGLPIKVQVGLIGKICLKIPWSSLFSQPVILCIEDVYIVAVPETYGSYDGEMQKRLYRATKKKILEDLEGDNIFTSGFLDDILSSVVKNFQITVNNVHVRYEERLVPNSYSVCGVCLQSLSIATTNNKWKPGVTPANSTSSYQLMKVESLSIYLNPIVESCLRNESSRDWDLNTLLAWKASMCRALQTFAMNNQEFQFLIKPFTTKVKVIISKKNNSVQVPRMLVDIVLQDVAMQISKQQYVSICQLRDSLQRTAINRQYRKHRPNKTVLQDIKSWWKYAYNVILEHSVRPYTHTHMLTHRRNYKKYKEAYMQTLLQPNDTELKLDLQKYEDTLTILNIVIAREHAKIELEKLHPERVTVEAREAISVVRLVHCEKLQDSGSRSNSFDGQKICRADNDSNEMETRTCTEKSPKTFDRKYNFTLANFSLYLLNNDREILVISITQFLASVETRPDSSSFKVSARAESFVVEGVSSENDLVSIVTTDNILTGNVSSNFLAIDFEKSALSTHCNYDISITLEPIEVTYYNYTVAEVIKFFERSETYVPTVTSSLYKTCMTIKREFVQLSDQTMSRNARLNLKMDIKGPYIVFPEHGSLQKEGYILLLDLGRMTLRSELQPADVQLEDATIMELEELLYDRLHLVFTDGQLILCHAGDEWREIRKLKESESHILPKLHANVTVACSIKPEYRILPRIKLNISASHLKFNLSENKIQLLVRFLNLLTIPSPSDVKAMTASFSKLVKLPKQSVIFSSSELNRLRSIIVLSSISKKQNTIPEYITKDITNCNASDVERSIISSEISEEDLEQWFRTSNFSGFEDIVSPHNHINLLLRFVIGELSFHFCQTASSGRQESYLILKLSNLYFESAVMKYGFAVQSGLGAILVADKTEANITGSYLELISNDSSSELFAASYRKIRANCPDFKSFFKNVERSWVMNITNLNVVFHRYAFMKLKNYFSNLKEICRTKSIENIAELIRYGITHCKKESNDPPVPPGAIKLSFSVRLNAFSLKLCNKEEDLLIIKLAGVENDCIYNANERMILRCHLRSLVVEDLNNSSLYTKILTSDDDDKVFDLKYVRHTPKVYKCPDIDATQTDIMTDGSFKLSVGRLNYVFISKMFRDCQRFLGPFLFSFWIRLVAYTKNLLAWGIEAFRRSRIILRISIDLQEQTLLLPQRKDSPTLLIFDIGTFSIENFFKMNEFSKRSSRANSFDSNSEHNYSFIVDNILIKLKAPTLFRAIMTLTGNVEMQEPIIDPINIRFDIKRKIALRTNGLDCQLRSLYDVQGSVDLVTVNLAQKDLTCIFSIWDDNISKLFPNYDEFEHGVHSLTSIQRSNRAQDAVVRKLEVFFSQDEQPVCEVSIKLTFDGLQVNLFSDTEEVLSSPVRDLNQGLCKLTFGEAITTLEVFNDKSLSAKVSVKSCELEDMRRNASLIKKIVQSPAKRVGINSESKIYVSVPPALDVTFTKTPAGDVCLDMLIEESRVNMSVPFLTELAQYLIDSLPHEQYDEGFINEAYEDNDVTIKNVVKRNIEANYLKRDLYNEEQAGYSMSIRVRKPEVLLFGDLKASNAHAILIQAELTIEKSRHKGSSSIICTLTDVRAKSKSQESYLKQCPHWVLRPCDIEIYRKESPQSSDVRVNVAISPVNLHLSIGVISTFTDIIGEILNFLKRNDIQTDSKLYNTTPNPQNDLWSPKKIACIAYKKAIRRDYATKTAPTGKIIKQVKICELKPVSVNVLFEMEETIERIPIIKSKLNIHGSISDWDDNFQLEINLKVCAFCYNVNHESWEPFIELCQNGHINQYKPWELSFRMYQAESCPLNSWLTHSRYDIQNTSQKKKRKDMESSEDESNEDMVFISPKHVSSSKINDINYNFEVDDESDYTDDEIHSEKLTQTFRHLFTMDSNDEERSDSDESSKYEDEDEGLELTPECIVESNRHVMEMTTTSTFLKTSAITPGRSCCRAIYMIIHSKDMLNFTISPNTIGLVDMIINAFSKNKNGIPVVPTKAGKLTLLNDIGHISKVEFFMKKEGTTKDEMRLVAARSFPKTASPSSLPSSPESGPPSNLGSPVGVMDGECDFNEEDVIPYNDIDCLYLDESILNVYNRVTKEHLRIAVEGFEDTLVYCSQKRQGYNLVQLRPAKDGIRYNIVVETNTDWRLLKTISVRSPMQIRNETSYALGLYYKKQVAEKLKIEHVGHALNPFDDNMRMAIIEPDDIYNVPLYIAYHCSIYILPAYLEKYQVSDEGISWQEMNNNTCSTKDIYCRAKEATNFIVFGVKAICLKERATLALASSQIPDYLIKILPPVVFDNKLPFPIDIDVSSIGYQTRIEPGEKANLYSIKCDKECQINFKMQSHAGCQWTGKFQLTPTLEKKFVKMIAENEVEKAKPFLLCIEVNRETYWLVTIYAQYWIINKTGLPLCIGESRTNTMYEIPGEELMILSQKESRKRRRSIRLKAQQSDWSASFKLDGISPMSLILCKDTERRRKYRILVEISISRLSPLFTKIVTFLPYFYIANKTKRTLRFMEENEEADLWTDILPGQSMPFWPYTESMKMRVKWKNSQLVSQHFDIMRTGKVVLRMDNGTALCVDIDGGSSTPFNITFQKYRMGNAPVRIDNLCNDLFLKINQVNLGQATLLRPLQCLLYTWDDPTKTRELVWNVYHSECKGFTAQFTKDGFGREIIPLKSLKLSNCNSLSKSRQARLNAKSSSLLEEGSFSSDDTDNETETVTIKNCDRVARDNNAVVYWVSYIEKEQRVLMFTQDENIFFKVRSIVDPEPSEREIFLTLAGIGLSIVINSSDNKMKELAYASLTDSAAHWELFIGQRWKRLTLELSAWLEDKYSRSFDRAQFENFIDINLSKMYMTKPFFGKLRRTYSPGCWLHCRKSATLTYLQGYFHRIQIDNQLHDAAFPIILHFNSHEYLTNLVGNRKLKHCIEFQCLKQHKITRNVYKEINIIIEEFSLNLQEDFLMNFINNVLIKQVETKHLIAVRLQKDLSAYRTTSFFDGHKEKEDENNDLIEHLYISPITMRLKLLAAVEESNIHCCYNNLDYCSIVRLIFDYACRGTFEKEAEFKLPCYKMDCHVLRNDRFFSNIWNYYAGKVMQQFNLFVLSIAVLGNPYGYNFKSATESTNEENSVLIYGDEVAEKLTYDMACLLGFSTVDSTLQPAIFNFYNAQVSFTSSKTATQIENKETMLPTPSVNNSMSIEIEIELAFLGVAVQSTDNTHQEELKYFFKSWGKKILRLMKKDSNTIQIYPDLVIDTFKRAQETGFKFISRIRLPRTVNPYTGVELYSTDKAKGFYLWNNISKSCYARNDSYWAHAVLNSDGKRIALVSLQRIFLIEKKWAWGTWNVEWNIEINHLVSPPVLSNNKITLHVSKSQKSSSPEVDWYLESKNDELLEWLCRRIDTAMILNMENGICPVTEEV